MSESEFEKAERIFREAIQKHKDGRRDEAISLLRRCVQENPSNAEAHQELGLLLYGYRSDLIESFKVLEEAVRLDPDLGDAHLYLALILARMGRYDSSEAHFLRSIALSDTPNVCREMYACFLGERGRLADAEREFQAVLSHDAHNGTALRDYARLLELLGRIVEADSMFLRAIAANPNDERSNYSYGEFLSHQENREREAEQYLRRALARDPNYGEAKNALEKLLHPRTVITVTLPEPVGMGKSKDIENELKKRIGEKGQLVGEKVDNSGVHLQLEIEGRMDSTELRTLLSACIVGVEDYELTIHGTVYGIHVRNAPDSSPGSER